MLSSVSSEVSTFWTPKLGADQSSRPRLLELSLASIASAHGGEDHLASPRQKRPLSIPCGNPLIRPARATSSIDRSIHRSIVNLAQRTSRLVGIYNAATAILPREMAIVFTLAYRPTGCIASNLSSKHIHRPRASTTGVVGGPRCAPGARRVPDPLQNGVVKDTRFPGLGMWPKLSPLHRRRM